MFSSILLLAAMAGGIEYGWERLPEGGMKYIVQFDPESFTEAQKAGEDVKSYVPSTVGDVRLISIRVGTGSLPKENPPAKTEAESPASPQESRKPESNAAMSPPLLQSQQGEPLANQTSYNEPAKVQKTPPEDSTITATSTAGELAKPWPLIGILLTLFVSLGGNFYLLWIFAELRKRYRALLVR